MSRLVIIQEDTYLNGELHHTAYLVVQHYFLLPSYTWNRTCDLKFAQQRFETIIRVLRASKIKRASAKKLKTKTKRKILRSEII